jgi:hypothetical protein
VIGHDFEMRVSKVPLARDSLPVFLFHAGKIINVAWKSECLGSPDL